MNKVYVKLLSFVLGIFLYQSSSSQDAFQRYYPTEDRILVNMGSIANDDGGFYMINLSIDVNDQTVVNKIQLTRNNPKGNLEWTKEYTLKDETLVSNLKSIDFTKLANDTIALTGITQDPNIGAVEDEKFVFKIDPSNGDLIWTGLISDTVDKGVPLTSPVVLNGFEDRMTIYNTHGNEDSDTFAIQRVQYNASNTVISQKAYFQEESTDPILLAGLLDAVQSVDSNDVVSFIPDLASNFTAVMTLDSLGNILSGNTYGISQDSLSDYIMQSLAVSSTPDTGVLMTGIIFQPIPNLLSNYLIKTDTAGIVEWSKVIDGTASGVISQVNDVLVRTNGEIVVSGKYFNILTQSQGDYMIYFDANGNVIKQLDYGSENSFFLLITPQGNIQFYQGEMSNTTDGGILYSTTGWDPSQFMFSPYIIKTDVNGGAVCNDSLDVEMVVDYAFTRDTLMFGTTDYVTTDTLIVIDSTYSRYDVPTLQLVDTSYCPQDPIDQLIEAGTDGATAYEWSTGDTTSSIRVFEEGDYYVTVTIGEKVCYSLCDTSTITKQDFPEASIILDLNGVCELGEIRLGASSSTSIDSLDWSTGEETGSIIVTTPGTYSVTITDNCGNSADASVSITDDMFTFDLASVINSEDPFCENGSAFQNLNVQIESEVDVQSIEWNTGQSTETIMASEQTDYSVTVTNVCGDETTSNFSVGDLDPDPNFSVNPQTLNIICNETSSSLVLDSGITTNQTTIVLWSTGETTPQIEVTEAGTYSVEVTNACGDIETGSINISDDQLTITPPSPSITVNIDSCDFRLVSDPGLAVNVIGTNPSYSWSNGETTEEITVETSGIYMVTVSDGCGNTGSVEIVVDADPEALRFADIFFPASRDISENRSFGPYIKCPETFEGQNFKFEIYNRFGNKVFESDNLNARWNGTFSGDLAPRDVYMYHWSYDTAGDQLETGEGSVTLMR